MNSRRRSSREIEAGIDTIREDMDATLDELERRLSPRELVREAVDSVGRLQTGRYLIGVAGLARRNPLRTIAAGAGIALLVSLAAYASRARR